MNNVCFISLENKIAERSGRTKASKGTPKNIIALNSSNFEQKNAILFLCDV